MVLLILKYKGLETSFLHLWSCHKLSALNFYHLSHFHFIFYIFNVFFFRQELQQKLYDVAPLLQNAREKGKLLTMMESSGEQGTKVQSKLDELSEKWDELQGKLNDRVADSERKNEAVAAFNSEVRTVAKRLNELAASTDDLTAISYDSTKVLEQRDNYEVPRE